MSVVHQTAALHAAWTGPHYVSLGGCLQTPALLVSAAVVVYCWTGVLLTGPIWTDSL